MSNKITGDQEMTYLIEKQVPKLPWYKRLLGHKHEHCPAFDYSFQQEYIENGVVRGIK